MTTVPTQEPSQIIAGDSVTWVRSLPDYPASLGWVLHYAMLSLGKAPILIDGTAQGNDHLVELTAVATAAYAAAEYRWTSYVTNGAERKTLASSTIRILPDPATATEAFDPRTENQKILDAITAVLAGELTNPLAKYKIAGREAERHSRMELLKLQSIYQHRVAVENGKAPFIGSIPIQFAENNGFPGGGLV